MNLFTVCDICMEIEYVCITARCTNSIQQLTDSSKFEKYCQPRYLHDICPNGVIIIFLVLCSYESNGRPRDLNAVRMVFTFRREYCRELVEM